MITSVNKTLLHTCDLKIGKFYFYKNFVISEIKESAVVAFEEAEKLFEFCNYYYGKKTPFVYLAHRINSYSFVPTDHFKSTNLFPNLKGYGVIVYTVTQKRTAELEKSFMNKKMKIFENLNEAIQWADSLTLCD
ncbi:hypothetical protein ACE939_01930 [Aquimarina sp. W85]|uniref:hypothetical protein n=1 Tax=Aquimarina rhodophyticola TaxID=3342246 RepID=UPI00366E07B6